MQIAAEEKLEIRPCKFDSPWKFAAARLPFLSSNYTRARSATRSLVARATPRISFSLFIYIYIKSSIFPAVPRRETRGRRERLGGNSGRWLITIGKRGTPVTLAISHARQWY